MSYKHSNSRVCSTAFAKYILEKWKNLRPLIRQENENNSKAARFYLFNLYKKGLQALVEGINILSHKRSLKLSVISNYCLTFDSALNSITCQ